MGWPGKCVMRECGGLQMPDYFTAAFYGDGRNPTYTKSQSITIASLFQNGANVILI